jgi:oligoribonuclease NrnB/cAMP/cGMP phosphodiesterase (DHH superfamily)
MSIAVAPTMATKENITAFNSNDTACIVTHVDLDGVGSGLIAELALCSAAKSDYLTGISMNFIGYTKGIGQRLKEAVEAKDYFSVVIVTDISLRGEDLDIFLDLVKSRPDTFFVWADHHSSSEVDRVPELPNLMWEVSTNKEDNRCGADIIHRMLFRDLGLQYNASDFILNMANRAMSLAHDYDLWIKKMPASQDVTDMISTLGPRKVWEFLSKNPTLMLPENYERHEVLWNAALRARKQRIDSLALVRATKTNAVINDQKFVFGVCQGYSSEAGHTLADGDPSVAAIVLDIRHEQTGGFNPGLSLRRADGSTINLKEIAEKLGGGGHEYAAGGKIPADMLIRAMLGATIVHCIQALKED